MIVRAKRPDRGFTILDNAVLRDERLSYRAAGILANILSRPDNWKADYRSLARGEGREGEAAVRTALKELERHGYLIRHRRRDERGRWSWEQYVYDTPREAASPKVEPVMQKPPHGDPHAEDCDCKEVPSKEDLQEDDLSRADATHRPADDEIKERTNWRLADRQLWRDIIGQDYLHVIEAGPWNLGTFTTDAFYDAFRKGARELEAKQWPGRYLDCMEDWEDWLLARGVALSAA